MTLIFGLNSYGTRNWYGPRYYSPARPAVGIVIGNGWNNGGWNRWNNNGGWNRWNNNGGWNRWNNNGGYNRWNTGYRNHGYRYSFRF